MYNEDYTIVPKYESFLNRNTPPLFQIISFTTQIDKFCQEWCIPFRYYLQLFQNQSPNQLGLSNYVT